MGTKLKGAVTTLKSRWNTPAEGRCLTFKEIGAYGLGGLGYSCLINTIYIILTTSQIPYIYNIKNVHGTTITLVVTILNLVIQPVFGKMFDNSKSKWGKFKLYFAIITPLIGLLTIAALWVPQADSETFRTVYAYATCVPTLILTGIYAMLYTNMPLVMTTNSQERADIIGPVNLIVGFAPTILNAIVPIIRGHFKQQNKEYVAYRLIAVIFVAMGLLMSILIIKFVKERVYVTSEKVEKIKFSDGIKQVLKNKPFMALQFINVFTVLKGFIFAQFYFIAMYKYSDIVGRGEQIFGGLSLITGFGATPAMLLAPLFMRKAKKKTLLIIAQLLPTIPLIGILMCGGFGNLRAGALAIIIITVVGFLFNFNTGIGVVANPTMNGELFDYQQYLTGQRLEGFMNAVTAWTTGLIGTLLSYIPVFFQAKIGFEQGDVKFQGAAAYLPENMTIINKWFNCAAIITVVASIIWMVGMKFFYKLDEKKHAEIMEVLKSKALNADNLEETALEIQAEAEKKSAVQE